MLICIYFGSFLCFFLHRLPSPSPSARPYCAPLPPVPSPGPHPELSFGLLLVVCVSCSLALLGLCAFASWKLCWVPWRHKAPPSGSTPFALGCSREGDSEGPLPGDLQTGIMATEKLKEPSDTTGFLEAAVKISHTSPDIPAEVQLSMKDHFLRRAQRMQRQTTEPASSTRSASQAAMAATPSGAFSMPRAKAPSTRFRGSSGDFH